MAELSVGSTFADHIIRGVAGRGGMGVVYRGVHLALKREVALKVIASEFSADKEFRTRFQDEATAAASIQHPHVIPIYHAGEEDGLLFVTMRYVEGTDLARLLMTRGRLSPEAAVRVTAQIAAGLEAAHARGLVHRDVKPANVLLEGASGEGAALLTDFGLTKQIGRERTQAGVFVGTFDYAAAEQFRGSGVDARADVYALGCVLYQALSGRVPYPVETDAAKMYAHMETPPPPVNVLAEDVPEALSEVVRRAMAKDPGERYQSASELRAALFTAEGHSQPPRPWQPDTLITPINGPPVQRTTIPLPPALTSEVGGGEFVGRFTELDALRARFAAAAEGTRQFVVLAGEAGIGKTRLAAELAREAHADGATVLFGRSDFESLVPYQPFITAIQHRVAHRSQINFPAELADDVRELGRFIPALRRLAPERAPIAGDPEADRFRLFAAGTHLLAFVARQHPVVLILDDLQWADASTVLLLSHMLQDPEPVKLLVVATMRETGEERSDELPDLLTRLRRQPSFERIPLAGLDAAETEALVLAREGEDLSDEQLQRLIADTDGNPFFFEEMLRGGLDVGVPAGAKEMIAR